MRNIKLILQYDGTDYHGWQKQGRSQTFVSSELEGAHGGDKVSPMLKTIQETIEDAITRLTGKYSTLIGAGRTDAGAHALAQVASFKTGSKLDNATIKRALNAMLSQDIRVIEVVDVDASFHARKSALSKTYIYLIAQGDTSVFLRRFLWNISYKLSLEDMTEGARFLEGVHDFQAFMGSGSQVKNTVRDVLSLKIEGIANINFLRWTFQGSFIKLEITANAFLRHMVRNIVGTLIEVGRGKIHPQRISEILALGQRRLAGPTAPSLGLFLERVNYLSDLSTASKSSFFS